MFSPVSYACVCAKALYHTGTAWLKLFFIFWWVMGFVDTCAIHFAFVALSNYARESVRMCGGHIMSRLNKKSCAGGNDMDVGDLYRRELLASKKRLDDWHTASVNRARLYMSYWSAINPVVVKIMQSFAGDFVHLGMDMDMFTKCVPIVESDVDMRTIDALHDEGVTFGADAMQIENMHAGMASIVIRGKYKTRDVAVKILRTNILSRIETGIREMKMLTDLVLPCLLSKCQTQYFNRIADTVYRDLIDQTELVRELENGRRLYGLVEATGMEFAHVPYCFSSITHAVPTALVMEWNDGCFIDDVDPRDALKYAENLIVFGASSVLFGLVHADMHPGNIQFMKGGHFAICDFGIMHRSTPEFQCRIAESVDLMYPVVFPEHFPEISKYSVEEDACAIAEICLRMGIFEGPDKSAVLPLECTEPLKQEIIGMYEDLRNTAVGTSASSNVHDNSGEIAMTILGAPHHLAELLHSSQMREHHITLNNEFVHMQTCVAMARGIALLLFTSAISSTPASTLAGGERDKKREDGEDGEDGGEETSVGAQFHAFIAGVFGDSETMATMLSATHAVDGMRDHEEVGDASFFDSTDFLHGDRQSSNREDALVADAIAMAHKLRAVNVRRDRAKNHAPGRRINHGVGYDAGQGQPVNWRSLTSVMTNGVFDVENMKNVMDADDISELEAKFLTTMCAISIDARLHVWLESRAT